MAVNIFSFKALVRKFAKKVARAYTINPEGRVSSGSERTSNSKCEATCILVSEDGYKEPVCLDHPTKEMEMEILMKGEVERVGVTGYEGEGGMEEILRGGCLFESGSEPESEYESEKDEWNEKTLCDGYEGYANLLFDVESLKEELYTEDRERAGALYLAFGDVDGEVEESIKEQRLKMKAKLVERVEKWLSKVEALDGDKMDVGSTCSSDVASVLTVETLVTEVTCVSEEKREVETWDRLAKNEIVEEEHDAGSMWNFTPKEELENCFPCKKAKEVRYVHKVPPRKHADWVKGL